MTFFTRTYWGLFVCRALTGFSIGGALPLIYSILGDLFRADERHKANAFVSMGTGLGISVGQAIAGFLGPTWGWRLPFLVVSTPALICAAVVLATVKDPERGGMEQASLERRQAITDNHDEIQHSGHDHDYSSNHEVEMQRLKTTKENDTESQSTLPTIPQAEAFGVPRKRSKDFPTEKKRDDDSDNDKTRMGKTHNLKRHLEPAITATKVLLKTPTVIFALLQGVPGCVPWGIGKFASFVLFHQCCTGL